MHQLKDVAATWEYAAAMEGIHLLTNSFFSFFAALSIPGQCFILISFDKKWGTFERKSLQCYSNGKKHVREKILLE